MKLQKNKKVFVIIIAIVFLVSINTKTLATWTHGELKQIDNAGVQALNDAKKMSVEGLEDAIEELNNEMNERANNDETYTALEQEKDREILNSYKSVYKSKSGRDYGSSDRNTGTVTDPITNPSEYDPTQTTVQTYKLTTIGGMIIGAIRVIGTVIAVIALVLIGFKYMMGSMEDRAKYKESMIPYIIGVVMLVATVNILGILYNMFMNIY